MARWIVVLALAVGCAADDGDGRRRPADTSVCAGDGVEQVLLARRITFAREVDGTSLGFDLDGLDSSADDPRGCYVADFEGPDGSTGVDNAMATLLPLLETTEAAALEPIVQDSINGGALLLLFAMTDLGDGPDDGCVVFDTLKGTGQPMIGNDGWMLPYQTLELDPDSPDNPEVTATMVDGVLETPQLDRLALTLQVLDLDTTLEMFNARVRLEEQADGTWRGLLGGGIRVQDIIDVATLQNIDPAVFDLIGPVLGIISDLEPDADGNCAQMSVSMELEMVPAFVYN